MPLARLARETGVGLRTLDPGMVTLALEGAASYRDKHELVLRRQAELPNAMWQSDHTMLDILVVGTDGKPARPWLTTILDDFTDAQAIAAIARITRGNFRLLERLFPQIQRVLKINELDTITNDVIEAAQSTLVIGVT